MLGHLDYKNRPRSDAKFYNCPFTLSIDPRPLQCVLAATTPSQASVGVHRLRALPTRFALLYDFLTHHHDQGLQILSGAVALLKRGNKTSSSQTLAMLIEYCRLWPVACVVAVQATRYELFRRYFREVAMVLLIKGLDGKGVASVLKHVSVDTIMTQRIPKIWLMPSATPFARVSGCSDTVSVFHVDLEELIWSHKLKQDTDTIEHRRILVDVFRGVVRIVKMSPVFLSWVQRDENEDEDEEPLNLTAKKAFVLLDAIQWAVMGGVEKRLGTGEREKRKETVVSLRKMAEAMQFLPNILCALSHGGLQLGGSDVVDTICLELQNPDFFRLCYYEFVVHFVSCDELFHSLLRQKLYNVYLSELPEPEPMSSPRRSAKRRRSQEE